MPDGRKDYGRKIEIDFGRFVVGRIMVGRFALLMWVVVGSSARAKSGCVPIRSF